MASILTPVTLQINSDWASFELISHDATIGLDPGFPYPGDARLDAKGLYFGKGGIFQNVILKFYIINDGSPVDFKTGHGDGSTKGSKTGKITVSFPVHVYLNDKISGDGLNGETVYGAPVRA